MKHIGLKILLIIFLSSSCDTKNATENENIQSSTEIEFVAKPDTNNPQEKINEEVELENGDSNYIEPKTEYKSPTIYHMDSVTIEGMSYQDSLNILLEEKGQPDSIIDPKYDCGYFAWEEIAVEVYYYPGMKFHVYDGKYSLFQIDFAKYLDILKHPKMNLSKGTTLEDAESSFPESASFSYDWEEKDSGRNYRILRLWPREGSDSEIVLKFYEGKLIELYITDPC